jgi:cellulose synthase/poly-beta-1,6-N-acetylglucosamine synthase-like glycosyltransferase
MILNIFKEKKPIQRINITHAPGYRFLRHLWTTTFALAIVSLSLLSATYNPKAKIVTFGFGTAFAAYALLIATHVITQIFRAIINYVRVKKLRKKAIGGNFSFPFCFLSFGHEESPRYYHPHLSSMGNLLGCVGGIFLIDGTSEANRAMVQMFNKQFPYPIGMSLVIPDFPDPGFAVPYAQMNEYHRRYLRTALQEVVRRNPGLKYFCLAQAHGGKREIMYLGMQIAHYLFPHIHGYGLTDSDTVMTEDAFLEAAHLFIDPEVEAVTGNVSIYNIGKEKGGNFLSRLANVQYWNAFFLERAAQSMTKSVLCMSGPRWMVRISTIFKEHDGIANINRWKDATFFGEPDNYGDDRGWTNVILASGGNTMFTPYGTCYTETPTDLKRFYRQQRRWNKSAEREAIRTIRNLGLFRHPGWAIYEIIYQVFFPFLLVLSIVFQVTLAIQQWSALPILSLLLMTFLGGLTKGIITAIISRDAYKIIQCVYGFLFIFLLIPAHIDALLHLWDAGWGTPSRANLKFRIDDRIAGGR